MAEDDAVAQHHDRTTMTIAGDRVSLVDNRNPDPELFADIVDDLRALG